MGKIIVCDFCERQKYIGTKLKVRGKRFVFIPGMFRAARYELYLCDECYVEMLNYIAKKTKRKSSQ